MARLQLGLREGWITVLLLAGTLLSVVWAIQRADWADSLDILTPIALAGLALGLALAKWRRLPFFVAHAIALLAGGWLVVNRLDPLLPLARDKHGWWAAFHFLRERGYTWITTAGTDKYADDFYLFLLGLATIVFFMSYLGAWMIFRDRWVWPALKINVIVQLTLLLVEIIEAIATTEVTFGASLLEIPAFKKLTDIAINFLMSQAMEVVLG